MSRAWILLSTLSSGKYREAKILLGWRFIPDFDSEQADHDPILRKLRDLLRTVRAETGLAHVSMFALFDDDRFDTSSILVTSYKLQWAAEYVAKGFSQVDPVYNSVSKSLYPVDWIELTGKSDAVKLFFDRFYEVNGGKNGISFPISRHPSVSAVASMVFDVEHAAWPAFKRAQLSHLVHCANVMVNQVLEIHQWSESTVRLTPRETECIYWASLGKSDAEIGDILSIVRWTVVAHIQSAKYKLNAFNRTGAVATAVALGLVKPAKATGRAI